MMRICVICCALLCVGLLRETGLAQGNAGGSQAGENRVWKYHPECGAQYPMQAGRVGVPSVDERGGQRAERDAADYGRSPYNCWRVMKFDGGPGEGSICNGLIPNREQTRPGRYRLSVRLRLPAAPLPGAVPVLRIKALEGGTVLLTAVISSGDPLEDAFSAQGIPILGSNSDYGNVSAGSFEHRNPALPMDYTLEWLGGCDVAVDYIAVGEGEK